MEFYFLTRVPIGVIPLKYYLELRLMRPRRMELFGSPGERWPLKSNFMQYSMVKDTLK